MEFKFSSLIAIVVMAAVTPPILSYLPQTARYFSDPSSSQATPAISVPTSQAEPYANSVNQLKELNQKQQAELENATSSNSNAPQWKRPQKVGMIHQVGYTPSEVSQPAEYSPARPIYPESSAPAPVPAPVPVTVQSVPGEPVATTVYYSEVPGQVIQTPQGVEVISVPVPQGVVVEQNLTGLEFWFKFNITPSWVEQNWDFVTACVGPMNLQGYRVTLVTGSNPDDLTGVLTYYFDSRKQLQQIQFQGTTGHLGRLTTMLRRQFHMNQRIVNDPAVTVYETPTGFRGAKNIMEARSPMVIKSDQLYHRYEVSLQLNRPVEKKGLIW